MKVVPIKKVVETLEGCTITLNREEALILATLVGNIMGPCNYNPRKITDLLYQQIKVAMGFKAEDITEYGDKHFRYLKIETN